MSGAGQQQTGQQPPDQQQTGQQNNAKGQKNKAIEEILSNKIGGSQLIYECPDLQEIVDNEIAKTIRRISKLKSTLFANKIVPERQKKIFQNIMGRCTVEIDCLMRTNFSERRQTELRWKLEKKLDMIRKEVDKLSKLTSDVKLLNNGNDDHVCRDIKKYYLALK